MKRKKQLKARFFDTFHHTHSAQHFFHKFLNNHLVYKYKPKEFMTISDLHMTLTYTMDHKIES